MRKNKKHFFIICLSLIITFLTSIALNISDVQAKLNNIDYSNYPKGFSVYNLLNIDNYKGFMEQNFNDFEYKTYYKSPDNVKTNILLDGLKIEVLGCEKNFSEYPLPSCYSDSINFSKLKSGKGFSDYDIINNSNAMLMYNSHLEKIGYNDGDYILINGIRFYLKGILEDNSDVIRHKEDNIIQIFIPYTTFASIFESINIKTVIKTDDFIFKYLNDDVNFLSLSKVNQKINRNKNYLLSTTLPLLIILIVISFISIIILQTILIKGRYNEIGIRRAVGASRQEIVYLFTKETLLSTILGVLIGIVMYFIAFTFIQLSLSSLYRANLFAYNFNVVGAFWLLYVLISFVSILIPTFLGTNINISTILVEER